MEGAGVIKSVTKKKHKPSGSVFLAKSSVGQSYSKDRVKNLDELK